MMPVAVSWAFKPTPVMVTVAGETWTESISEELPQPPMNGITRHSDNNTLKLERSDILRLLGASRLTLPTWKSSRISYSIRNPDSKSFDYRADISSKATAFMRNQDRPRITLVSFLNGPRACFRAAHKQ